MKREESYYLVSALTESAQVDGGPFLGLAPIAMCWADGMVGAMPVFKDRASAEAYVDGNGHEILEVSVKRRVRS